MGAQILRRDEMEQDTKPTMPVPEAGRKYFGLGRNASYAAAARGEIPTIKIGARIFAVVAALEQKLEEAGLKDRTEARTKIRNR
jgi:hypothetical protein